MALGVTGAVVGTVATGGIGGLVIGGVAGGMTGGAIGKRGVKITKRQMENIEFDGI